MAKLGNFIREHPEYLVANEDNIGEKIYLQNLAYVTVNIISFLITLHYFKNKTKLYNQALNELKMMIYNDFKRSGKCRLFIAKEQFSQNLFSFALQKSDPMTKSLSDE